MAAWLGPNNTSASRWVPFPFTPCCHAQLPWLMSSSCFLFFCSWCYPPTFSFWTVWKFFVIRFVRGTWILNFWFFAFAFWDIDLRIWWYAFPCWRGLDEIPFSQILLLYILPASCSCDFQFRFLSLLLLHVPLPSAVWRQVCGGGATALSLSLSGCDHRKDDAGGDEDGLVRFVCPTSLLSSKAWAPCVESRQQSSTSHLSHVCPVRHFPFFSSPDLDASIPRYLNYWLFFLHLTIYLIF
jgi:hypothetical protein